MKAIFLRAIIVFAGMFVVQAAGASDIHFASGNSALSIPFELAGNDHICLHVRINDSAPLLFILDTGASSTTLSERMAKTFGLNYQLFGKASDATGVTPPSVYLATDNHTVSLPGVELADRKLMIMPMDSTNECLKNGTRTSLSATQIDGILGADFFRDLVIVIDYRKKLIDLYDPSSYKYSGRGETIPLEIEPGFTFVRAKITGPRGRPVAARLVLDTGGGMDVALNQTFSNKHKLFSGVKVLKTFTDCGAGGWAKNTASLGLLRSLQLGGVNIKDPAGMFFQVPEIPDSDGILGDTILSRFKVIFDYSRSRMILEKQKQ